MKISKKDYERLMSRLDHIDWALSTLIVVLKKEKEITC
jgi:hypothetical protein